MIFRRKQKETLKVDDECFRIHLFGIIRDMISTKNISEAKKLIDKTLKAKRVSIDDIDKWLANMSNIPLYPERNAYSDVAELIVFNNVIDYTLCGTNGEMFLMIGSDGSRVFIYCPNNNILVDFGFSKISNLTSLTTYFMIGFSIIYSGKTKIGD